MTQSRLRVLIVGAGPTGCTLALLLARAGIGTTLVEKRTAPKVHPAACILNTRTMEVFREIGLAADILRHCQNIFDRANITWATSLSGRELGRCSAMPDDIATLRTRSSVHATHFPQNRLEPLLWQQVRNDPLVEFVCGLDCVDLTDAGTGGRALFNGPADEIACMRSEYVVGCDGASSAVRQAIGISAEGPLLQHMIGIHFVADLTRLVGPRKSILYWILNPDAFGVLIAQWMPDEWVLFIPYFPPQQSPEDFSGSRCRALVQVATGSPEVEVDIRDIRPWTLSARLASRYRNGQVFLAGDAAHTLPPTGGLGLNTAVQDAHNLAWKLAAVLEGRADPELLESYEEERRPVAIRNLEHSVRNFENMNDLYGATGLDYEDLHRLQALQNRWLFRRLPAAWQKRAVERMLQHVFRRLAILQADDADGRRARDAFARRIPGQAPHYRFLGLDLGVRYREGAFVLEETARTEADDPVMEYRPTTRPGARLPHFWVEKEGEHLSIHDILGPGFLTLLVHSGGSRAWRIAHSQIAGALPMPIRCFSVGTDGSADLVDAGGAWATLSETGRDGAVLVRPDGHVAWRAKSLPDAPADDLRAAVNACRGAGSRRREHSRVPPTAGT